MIGAGEARDLLERHGLAATKALGQNFVTDPGTVGRIVREAGVGPQSRVIEIGPGLGSLTLALAATGADVVAVEKDEALLVVLDEVLARLPEPRPTVVHADALELDWPALLGPDERILVANLPYNVAVPLVLQVLESAPTITRLVVMVQLEVAERLCAGVGGRAPGIPTVKLAWWATARIVMRVPPEVFTPRPRVHSAVVDIVRRDHPVVGNREVAFDLVDRAFHQRRKMLRSSLRSVVGPDGFDISGVDPRARPEQLEVHDWARLAEVVAR